MVKLQPLITRLLVMSCCLVMSVYVVSRLLTTSSNSTSTQSKDDSSTRVLFFNRVPKTGSELLVLLMTWLQARNSFTHVRLKNSVVRHLSVDQQNTLATDISEHLKAAKTKLVSFDRHVHFTNLSTFSIAHASYLNIVRDPIDKVASRFYYARATPRPGGYTPSWATTSDPHDTPPYATLEACILAGNEHCTFVAGREYDLAIPYFCGHESYCRELGNLAALDTAKRHLTEFYPVVGVLEELNVTLAVLQATLPQFFAGVMGLYYHELGAPYWNKNFQRPPTVSEAAEAALRRNLSLEVDFYNFARDRLLEQFTHLQV